MDLAFFCAECSRRKMNSLRLLAPTAWLLLLFFLATFAEQQAKAGELELARGWQPRTLAQWQHTRPDMLVLSPDGRLLFLSCETTAAPEAASLAAIDLQTGKKHILLRGLHRADGLKLAPDGSLWLGEEHKRGRIWRIAWNKTVNATGQLGLHTEISPIAAAGIFSHEGIAFSKNGRYAYLADEWRKGSLFRLDLKLQRLAVLHATRGWLSVADPTKAREESLRLEAMKFDRIEDMETLPDGRLLLAETGSGKVLMIDDRHQRPVVDVWLEHPLLHHPDNLAWDTHRGWLWITDDSEPSVLFAWDGRQLRRIAQHAAAEITGVLPHGIHVYINLQTKNPDAEATVELSETR